MSRFTDYQQAFDEGLTLWPRYDLVNPDGLVLASTEPTAGTIHWGAEMAPLRWDAGAISQRSATLTVVGDDPDLIPSTPDSLLHPKTSNAVVVYENVNGTDVRLATLTPNRAEPESVADVADIEVELLSRVHPLNSELESRVAYDEGTPIHSLIHDLMEPVMGSIPFSVAETPWVMPVGAFAQGDSRIDKITKLLTAVGYELADDAEGRVYTRPVLPSGDGDGERWTYGTDGYPIHSAASPLSDQIPEAVKVVGGSFQNPERGPVVVVFDTDPTSAGFYDGSGPARMEELPLPMVLTEDQGVEVGYARLRLKGSGPQRIRIKVLPNPMLREGDLVELDYPALKASGTFRVIGYELPLAVEGLMTIDLRKIFEPRVAYRGNGSDNEFSTSISDDFNRPYENLENDPPPGEPGSPNWTEFGWSWAVVQQRAVQRYYGWSFARYNTPLESSAQWAEVEVHPRSGHEVGPMIRSSGQYDGYSALALPSGEIRVVSWTSQHNQTTIGSFTYSGSLVGQVVRLEGSGSTLTVKVNGTEVGSLTDDRHHGTYAGMVAYGGSGAAMPAADNFQGGLVT